MPPPLRGCRRPVPGAARCSRRTRRGRPPTCCSRPCRAPEPRAAPHPRASCRPSPAQVGRAFRKGGTHLPRPFFAGCAFPHACNADGLVQVGAGVPERDLGHPAGQPLRILRQRRHVGRLPGAGNLGAGQPARAVAHERVRAAHRILDQDVHLVGAPCVGHVGRKLGDALCDRGRRRFARSKAMARNGTLRPPTGGPPSVVVDVPRARAAAARAERLHDHPRSYLVGPNSGAPRACGRTRCTVTAVRRPFRWWACRSTR